MKVSIFFAILSFFIWSAAIVPVSSAVTKEERYKEEDTHDHEGHSHDDETQEHADEPHDDHENHDKHDGHDHGKGSDDRHTGHSHEVENRGHEEDSQNKQNTKGHLDHEDHDHSKMRKYDHKGHDHVNKDNAHTQHDSHEKIPRQHKEHAGHDDHEEHGGHEGHDDHGEEGVINLDDEARSMIQLKTENVSRRSLGGHLKVYGKIAKDTENYSYVTFNGEGTVQSIKTKLGDIVNKGTELLTVKRDDEIHEPVKSEIHGMVMSIFVKPGDRVESLTSLISVIDVDTLRATIDIYERDLRLVQVGQDVKLSTAAYPDKIFKGKVVYISPQVDEHTQAIKVRVDIDNPEHLLRLGMFVSGELIYSSKREVLAIPLTAVQRLEEEDIVFVAEEGSSLRLREVVLGRGVNDYVEVRKGLVEGEVVVTQGSFYLKSEQAKESFGHGHAH